MKTQDRDTKFVPVPADFFQTKTGRRLFRAGPIHQLRFLWLVFKAHELRQNGRLVGSDLEPLDVEDLADDHDGDVEGWNFTIEVCHDLNLVSTDEDGVMEITQIEYWSRPPSARPEATRERKKRQREREKKTKDEQDEPSGCHGESQPSRESRPRQRTDTDTEENRSRSDQTTDQNRSEESQRGEECPLGLPVCRSSFVNFCFSVHERVTGKAFPKAELASIDKLLRAPPWSEYPSWRDRAGALQTAELQMSYEADRGKKFKNPWFYLLTAAGGYLQQAKDINRANDFAVSRGYSAKPHIYEWPTDAEQERAAC